MTMYIQNTSKYELTIPNKILKFLNITNKFLSTLLDPPQPPWPNQFSVVYINFVKNFYIFKFVDPFLPPCSNWDFVKKYIHRQDFLGKILTQKSVNYDKYPIVTK